MEFRIDNLFRIVGKGIVLEGSFVYGSVFEGETIYIPTRKGMTETKVLEVKNLSDCAAILVERVKGAIVGTATSEVE